MVEVKLLKNFGNYIDSVIIEEDQLYINVNAKNIVSLLFCLKNYYEFQYVQLLDLFCIDLPMRKIFRFEIRYLLCSIIFNKRCFLRIFLLFDEVESISNMYFSSKWLEREVWDMFGIVFLNHNDLRRLLTDYGFEGFPLRKDFPLFGFYELYYNEEVKTIESFPIEMLQDGRFYHNYSGNWNNVKLE